MRAHVSKPIVPILNIVTAASALLLAIVAWSQAPGTLPPLSARWIISNLDNLNFTVMALPLVLLSLYVFLRPRDTAPKLAASGTFLLIIIWIIVRIGVVGAQAGVSPLVLLIHPQILALCGVSAIGLIAVGNLLGDGGHQEANKSRRGKVK
jgi:energy-coupling factor transporter transmembrane protein EcfT